MQKMDNKEFKKIYFTVSNKEIYDLRDILPNVRNEIYNSVINELVNVDSRTNANVEEICYSLALRLNNEVIQKKVLQYEDEICYFDREVDENILSGLEEYSLDIKKFYKRKVEESLDRIVEDTYLKFRAMFGNNTMGEYDDLLSKIDKILDKNLKQEFLERVDACDSNIEEKFKDFVEQKIQEISNEQKENNLKGFCDELKENTYSESEIYTNTETREKKDEEISDINKIDDKEIE